MKTDDHATLDVLALRKVARDYMSPDMVPRYEIIKRHSASFSRDLWALIKEIEQIASCTPDEVVVKVALAGVGEARRRLGLIERAGLMGEHDRVTMLARSVLALCDHYEALTQVTVCLACDQTIEATDVSVPYDKVSPSGGAARSGRIHARCARAGRPRR
ncbi:DUF6415 family natural product biosynthesis protein [Streptomyces cylindrosporus]|uniref:DUF6415 family natural product biosynthesis protein n=1 Tax=Streptomyces cylindrosporus TaxID=2927583 RepID=A0ABS9YJY0_9ACTN|nr:DUF6415 family natural product biosynthesis protein [Streptomyces cylindrosporus]MCI3277552.1 DUF6415 family natural product biosynthesis protein [Streptomyces cylindrosporus]